MENSQCKRNISMLTVDGKNIQSLVATNFTSALEIMSESVYPVENKSVYVQTTNIQPKRIA